MELVQAAMVPGERGLTMEEIRDTDLAALTGDDPVARTRVIQRIIDPVLFARIGIVRGDPKAPATPAS
jgi:hypothetical protein